VGLLFDPLEAFLSVAGRRFVFNVVSPVVFLGGLGLALALNLYTVTRLNLSKEDGTIVSTMRVRLGLWDIAVAAVSVLLLVTLVGYVFLENFAHRY
jgi:asparagine N-glycosylation enzyme membrane subunit Stt3